MCHSVFSSFVDYLLFAFVKNLSSNIVGNEKGLFMKNLGL